MVKLLQKYNRWILVIFGALLMIAFLLPQTLNMVNGDPTSETRFTIGGRKVSAQEAADAAAKYAELKRYAPQQASFASTAEQWLLLTELADRSGVKGNKFDGVQYTSEIANQMFEQAMRQAIQQAMQTQSFQMYTELTKRKDELIKSYEQDLSNRALMQVGKAGNSTFGDALAEARAIERLIGTYAYAPRASEGRVVAQKRKQADEATLSYVLVTPGDGAMAAAGEVDDAAMQAHFDKFKSVPVGGGEFGVGYTFPDRLRLTYLVIDRNTIAAKVSVDPVEVQRRLLDKPGDDKVPMDQRRAMVESSIRDEKVTALFREARDAVRGELLKIATSLPEVGGYKAVPNDPAYAQRIDLKQVAARASAKLKAASNVDISFAVLGRESDLLSREQFGGIAGLGSAELRRGTVTSPAAETLFAVKELREADAKNKPTLPVQVSVPVTEPFEDRSGNAYFVLIAGAKKKAPAESLAEVKTEVISNVKRLRAYETLQSQLLGWRALGTSFTLAEVATQIRAAGYSVSEVKTDVRMSRGGGAQPNEAGVTEKPLVELVMSQAERLNPTLPMEQNDPLERMIGAPAPKRLGAVIGQLTQYSPLTVESLRNNTAASVQAEAAVAAFTDVRKSVRGFISPAHLAKVLSVGGPDAKAIESRTTEPVESTDPSESNDQ